jgi:hypothetical protein
LFERIDIYHDDGDDDDDCGRVHIVKTFLNMYEKFY